MQAKRNVSTARTGQLFSPHAQWMVVKTLKYFSHGWEPAPALPPDLLDLLPHAATTKFKFGQDRGGGEEEAQEDLVHKGAPSTVSRGPWDPGSDINVPFTPASVWNPPL